MIQEFNLTLLGKQLWQISAISRFIGSKSFKENIFQIEFALATEQD